MQRVIVIWPLTLKFNSIHVKLDQKKFKRGRSPFLHLAKEGDFARNHSAALINNLIHQHSNSGWNFENDEIFPPYNGLKLIIWWITFYYHTLWILFWLNSAFSLQNSIQFILFKEKMIGRKWDSKRRFPLLGGRWMFRRKMGSKRGSLPPKSTMSSDIKVQSYLIHFPTKTALALAWVAEFVLAPFDKFLSTWLVTVDTVSIVSLRTPLQISLLASLICMLLLQLFSFSS